MSDEVRRLVTRCVSRRVERDDQDAEDVLDDDFFTWLGAQDTVENAYRNCKGSYELLTLLEGAGYDDNAEILRLALEILEHSPAGESGKRLADYLVDPRSQAVLEYVRERDGDVDLVSDEVFDLAFGARKVLSEVELGAIEAWAAKAALQLVEDFTWPFDALYEVLDCALSANGPDGAERAHSAICASIRSCCPAEEVVARFRQNS